MLDFNALLDHGTPGVVHVVVPGPVEQQKVGQLEDEVRGLPLLHQQRANRDPREALAFRLRARRLPGPRANSSHATVVHTLP